jgi:predicted ribosomally synthesized peptide with SipW-like signal peptide
MKRIILSLSVIAVVAAVAVGATTAFFSDTETSEGNTFMAGAIDLKIDNMSYYNGEFSEGTSWQLADLTDELFFDFHDLKPGDWGEDTISLHVDNNDAWVCADIELTANDDVSSMEPELTAGDVEEDAQDLWDGELADELEFIFWVDDEDNVLEIDEMDRILMWGPASELFDETTYPIADSQFSITEGPLAGEETYFIGKAWCFGDLEPNPVEPGEGVDPTVDPGIDCYGEPVTNMSQSDMVMGNVTFTAVQSRNNEGFVCNEID